jgi:hypothetical protein
MKVPDVSYENKFRPQPISLPSPHPASTNRFPIHCLAASQNDSKVRAGVSSLFPSFVKMIMTIDILAFCPYKQKTLSHYN